VKRLALLVLVLCGACKSSSSGPSFSSGACEQFGVDEPVPVPESCGIDIADDGETVRVFAIGPVIRYAEMEDYASFCQAWDDVVRTEVLPCLADDKPNLLVFPENSTLAGSFIGSRGAAGRATNDTLAGFLSLLTSYVDPIAYYRERFPEASANQQLVLALTDTTHRAFQTFPTMAELYGVYIAVSSDFAPAELSDDPSDIAVLADPDLESVSSVYVATEGTGYNWGLYFGPDGREIARVAKSYLVPAEEDLLDLSHGALTQMRPVELPFANSGMVISKDAWMPGLLHRLDALGANLMLQPEAFSGWGVEEYEGDWLPDIVRQSAWAHTQRHGSFRHTVTPCIKGNLLGLVFDGQSHVTSSSHPDDAPGSFVGEDPYLGLLTVEPWVIEDPGPPMSLEERQTVLRDRGNRMLPGSGDPLEDAYAAEVVAADISLPLDGRSAATGDGGPGELGQSVVVAEPLVASTHQRFPALASDGNVAIIAWMEGKPGAESVRVFVEDDGGEFEEVDLGDTPGVVQRLPRVAAGAGRLAVVWEEELADETNRIVSVTRVDGTWKRAELTDPVATTAWEPDVAIDRATGRFLVTWLDLRSGGRPKPWIARSDDGESWQPLQVDPSNDIVDSPRGDGAFVRVAARADAVVVAFADFREFSWDVYLSTSDDGGSTFSASTRIDPMAKDVTPVSGDDPVESERIHGDVAISIDSSGRPVVGWTERQDRRYESRIRIWRDGETARADDATGTTDAWRPALAVTDSGDVIVVWQDLRDGTNRIRYARTSGASLEPGTSAIVDDAAAGTHLYGPQVTTMGAQVWVAWEDPRSGYARVRMAESAEDATP
jgi:predicted amidohydrolase